VQAITPKAGNPIGCQKPEGLLSKEGWLRAEVINREVLRYIEYYRPNGFKDGEELLSFIELCWGPVIPGFKIPRAKVCPEHTPPAQFIVDAFLDRHLNCVVWANRSGGKTFDGALLTWLDSVFKGGCETKILGGSGEQSQRMLSTS
jgi:hypothetical protein